MTDPNSKSLLHATAIALAVDADGPLAGVLILGPSGAGKSSLALAAIEGCPFARTALVADDQVSIAACDGGLIASAPPALKGLIEVRGFGPAPVRSASAATLLFAVDLGTQAERVSPPGSLKVTGDRFLPLHPFRWIGAEAAAAHRLRVMARQVLCGQTGEEPQDGGS